MSPNRSADDNTAADIVTDNGTLALLKAIFSGCNRSLACQTYCHKTAQHAIVRVSISVRWDKPSKMNRKFTDIVPLIDGKLIFSPELRIDASRYAQNCSG